MRRGWNPFTMQQWLAWLGATMIAAMTLVVFLYQNFSTRVDVEKRFDRIENKLDQLIFLRK